MAGKCPTKRAHLPVLKTQTAFGGLFLPERPIFEFNKP
jgi:hypothetical protein